MILHSAITEPSNYRASSSSTLAQEPRRLGLAGIDTRALTALIREQGHAERGVAHEPSGRFDLDALRARRKACPGLVGMDLAPM